MFQDGEYAHIAQKIFINFVHFAVRFGLVWAYIECKRKTQGKPNGLQIAQVFPFNFVHFAVRFGLVLAYMVCKQKTPGGVHMAKKNNYVDVDGAQYLLKKSKYCVNESPVHVSDSMSGKMSGIPSISTSCLVNPICLARMKNGDSVCSKCFAETTLKRYTACGEATESNFHLLNHSVLGDSLIPMFGNVSIARIESFGDVASETQAHNYWKIITANPLVRFAWFSKNMKIIEPVFNRYGKPHNVVMIESSPRLNEEIKPSSWIVDKVFTVFTADYVKAHNIEINCGARCCATCRRCYRFDTEKSVKELLKGRKK